MLSFPQRTPTNVQLAAVMSNLWIVRQIISFLLIAANSVKSRQPIGDCPHAYWDEPSRRCSDSLHQVLEEIRTSDHLISAELKLNKTCKEWDRTNACYQRLIQQCHSDATALNELRVHIGRYVIYSRPCQNPSLRYRNNMADCFLPDFKDTRTCTEAIDKYLKKYEQIRDYRAACRVISASMKCFHEIKENIRLRCRQEGANEYQQNYILPLVEQTRVTVLTQCNLTIPYNEYYLLYSSTQNEFPLNRFLLWTVAFMCCAFFSPILSNSFL